MIKKTIPEKLYHYTTIETLAYILESKHFKFNRLDNLDDTTEGLTQDSEHIRKYYFVSSWTSLEEENLAFWSMYTNDMQGIRLEMEPFPFLYFLNDKWISHREYLDLLNRNEIVNLPEIERLENIYDKENELILSAFIPESHFLVKVQYSYDKTKLEPKFYTSAYSYRPFDVGVYKHPIWKFQQEWRYRLIYDPNCYYGVNERDLLDLDKSLYPKSLQEHKNLIEEINPNKQFKYMKICEKALQKMKIVIGPKASDADMIIIKSLLHKYGLEDHVEVSWSHLKGSIR